MALIPDEVKKAAAEDVRDLFQRYTSRRLLVWLAIAMMSAVVLRASLKATAWAVYNSQVNTQALSLLLDFAKWFLGGFFVVSIAYAGFQVAKEIIPLWRGTNGNGNGGDQTPAEK